MCIRDRSNSDSTVVVRASASASPGAVDVVLTSTTGATATQSLGWTYLVAGVISTLTPGSGQIGTVVTISGSNLLGGGSTISSITLAGTAVSQITSFSNNNIVVVAAQATAGTGDVIIVANTGATTVATNGWTALTTGAVTAVTPASGIRGTAVVITGQRLLGGGSSIVSVSLAGVSVLNIASSSDTTVSVRAGDGSGSGSVVLVANTGAIVTQANAWAYQAPGVISSVTPNTGQFGTKVTISGTRLLGDGAQVTIVTLAGVEAEVVSFSNTMVVVVAQASVAVNGDIVITLDTSGLVVLTNGWTYGTQGIILAVSPSSGQQNTRVTIFGSNLFGYGNNIASVTLNGQSAFIDAQTLSLIHI